jgi:hypothetical protein
MAKKQRETANDVVFLLDGETLTGERLDVASIDAASLLRLRFTVFC